MPHKRHVRCKVEALVESFILLDTLLFKLVTIPDKEKEPLAIQKLVQTKSLNLSYQFIHGTSRSDKKLIQQLVTSSLFQISCIIQDHFEHMSYLLVIQK